MITSNLNSFVRNYSFLCIVMHLFIYFFLPFTSVRTIRMLCNYINSVTCAPPYSPFYLMTEQKMFFITFSDKMIFGLSTLLFRSGFFPFRGMASATPAQTPSATNNLDQNELHSIGRGFWNVRGRFKILKLIDIETQMSIIQLSNGKFLVIDTVEMDDRLRQEIDQLTNGGEKIEAVIATHPFHTLSFPAFYKLYPKPAYYGTPRHLRRLTEIPWAGNLDDCNVRTKWEPDVEMRIPAGFFFK